MEHNYHTVKATELPHTSHRGRGGRGSKYPFASMEVNGDALVIHFENQDDAEAQGKQKRAVAAAVNTARKSDPTKKFKTWTTEHEHEGQKIKGIAVHRVA